MLFSDSNFINDSLRSLAPLTLLATGNKTDREHETVQDSDSDDEQDSTIIGASILDQKPDGKALSAGNSGVIIITTKKNKKEDIPAKKFQILQRKKMTLLNKCPGEVN